MPSDVRQCLNYSCNFSRSPPVFLSQSIFFPTSLVSLSASLETSSNILGGCFACCVNRACLFLLSSLPPYPLPPTSLLSMQGNNLFFLNPSSSLLSPSLLPQILEIVDYYVTDGLTDLRLFAVMASLAQKIAALE